MGQALCKARRGEMEGEGKDISVNGGELKLKIDRLLFNSTFSGHEKKNLLYWRDRIDFYNITLPTLFLDKE